MEDTKECYHDYRIAIPAYYQDVFSHFYFASNKSKEFITKTFLPSYQTILIFSFGAVPFLQSQDRTKLPVERSMVLGPVKRAFNYTLPPGAEILVVNFIDDAFYRFFGNASISEHVPMDPNQLLPEDCFERLSDQLRRLSDTTKRVNAILDFCNPYLLQRDKIAAELCGFKRKSFDPIKAVASANNQSERNIQLHQKKFFGYSAKEFSRYQRFLKAIRLLDELATIGRKVNWFEVIAECGYYDQSQLVNDFKHYINISPTKYLKFQKDICNPVS